MITGIPRRWRLLSGQDNWKNLLDPLDIDLRRYIIHYGERAQAAYDTFNSERGSKYAGGSLFATKHLFERVGLEKGNPFKYEAVKYIYATSTVAVPESFMLKPSSEEAVFKESNWMGYVAVATDEGKAALGRRDILISWRGTMEPIEWVKDFQFPLVPATKLFKKPADIRVHEGFLSIYTSANPQSKYNKTSARDQVLVEVTKLVEVLKDEEISITITGHSLGAALGTLNAADIVAHGYNKSIPVTVFAFGSARVGDSGFAEFFYSLKNLHLLRIRNIPDIIPNLPPFPYCDVGQQLLIDSSESPYLLPPVDPFQHHLEADYLHVVAGTQGSKGGFHLEVQRDIALVNKDTDLLKNQYMMPQNWWCLQNKGMVQQEDGHWQLHDHELED